MGKNGPSQSGGQNGGAIAVEAQRVWGGLPVPDAIAMSAVLGTQRSSPRWPVRGWGQLTGAAG